MIQISTSFSRPVKTREIIAETFLKAAEFIISPTSHPLHLDISKDRSVVFYGGGFGFNGIYAMSITAVTVPSAAYIDGSRMFYGFNINPSNGDIFAFDATDFTAPGTLYRYSAGGR